MLTIKSLFLSLILVLVAVPSSHAAPAQKTYSTIENAIKNDDRAQRTIRAYVQAGYQEVSRESFQRMYLVAPTTDYVWGEYVITLRKSADSAYLNTYYVRIQVEMMVDIDSGKLYTGKINTEETIVR